MNSAHSIFYAFSSISVKNSTNVRIWIFERRYRYWYRRKNVDIGWQRPSDLNIIPDINVFFVDIEEKRRYWLRYRVAKTLGFEYHTRYRRFFTSISKKNVDIDVFVSTISNKNFYIGLIISISGTISCIIYRFEFWQDRVLSCTILPEMLQTMIWMIIAQWMKMSASISRINNLYISQLQLECWDQWHSSCQICLTFWKA